MFRSGFKKVNMHPFAFKFNIVILACVSLLGLTAATFTEISTVDCKLDNSCYAAVAL